MSSSSTMRNLNEFNSIQPILSIILPVYNVGKLASRAIESVLRQTADNIELIVINDASTDDTGKYLNYSSNDRVKITILNSISNNGLSTSRNIGLNKAQGQYVMFLDGDDYLLASDFLEEILRVIRDKQADWVSFPFVLTYEKKRPKIRYVGDELLNMYSGVWNKIYKKSLFDKLTFPDGKVFEDIVVSLKLAQKAKSKITFSEPGVAYWQRRTSIVRNSVTSNGHNDAIDIMYDYVILEREISNRNENKYLLNHLFNHVVVANENSGLSKDGFSLAYRTKVAEILKMLTANDNGDSAKSHLQIIFLNLYLKKGFQRFVAILFFKLINIYRHIRLR